MSVSRVRENRTHGSMRRREATPDQSAQPHGPRTPPADPTKGAAGPPQARRKRQSGLIPTLAGGSVYQDSTLDLLARDHRDLRVELFTVEIHEEAPSLGLRATGADGNLDLREPVGPAVARVELLRRPVDV